MIQLEPFFAMEISDAIIKAITAASQGNDIAQFEFNGVTVRVGESSDPTLIYRDWWRGLSGYLGDNPEVGPYPSEELTEAQKESDAAIQAARDEQMRKRHEEAAKLHAERMAEFREAMSAAPAMQFRDESIWKEGLAKNSDGYGRAVYTFAEQWARLMQAEVDKGVSVAECAKDLSSLADTDGITGFMYGCAVSILAACWIHGEELRRWHNLDTQLGNEGEQANEEGGVLNPAIISFR